MPGVQEQQHALAGKQQEAKEGSPLGGQRETGEKKRQAFHASGMTDGSARRQWQARGMWWWAVGLVWGWWLLVLEKDEVGREQLCFETIHVTALAVWHSGSSDSRAWIVPGLLSPARGRLREEARPGALDRSAFALREVL